MVIINVKEGESIDRALKRYKRRHRDAQVVKELRKRKEFIKPSVRKRNETLKAVYRSQKMQELGLEE
ncbi:MAG TPA: 30S ribosomal protein S21 [Saprospiraceae bacterium]|nr:30S ribosomal protein S21 [Saprospiraceae bacterium]